MKNEDVLYSVKEEKNITHNVRQRKPNWIYKYCFEIASKHVIEGKIEGTRRRGRRRKEQLDELRIRNDSGTSKRKY